MLTGWAMPFRCRSLHYFIEGKSLCWNKQRGHLTTRYIPDKPELWSSRRCVKCQTKLKWVGDEHEKFN